MTDRSTDQLGGASDGKSPDHPLVAFSEADLATEPVELDEEQVTIRVDTDRSSSEFRSATVGGGNRVMQSRLVALAGDEVPPGIYITLRDQMLYHHRR